MSAILCIQKWLIFKLAGITESDPSCYLKEGLTGKVWTGVSGLGNCPYFDHLFAPFCPTCRQVKQELRCRRQLCSAQKQFRRPKCPSPSLIFKLQWYKYRQIKKHKTGNKQKAGSGDSGMVFPSPIPCNLDSFTIRNKFNPCFGKMSISCYLGWNLFPIALSEAGFPP